MKYSDKAKARTHPYVYDVDSRNYQQGAHRHWFGRVDKDGCLNKFGISAIAMDTAILSRRGVRRHRFVPAIQ